jgi:DNA-cytosine methyltransferase
MNVLSLFDGISCARIALDKLGIPVNNYFASEIDKPAIGVSKFNYPDIIHLGNVENIDVSKLPKIDLLIGGSPCQDLSNAWNGLGLEGCKSRLFYEFVRIYKQLKPKYFLLENVKNKWGNLMSEILGTDFIEINSNVFSAQSRPRYYWTNINFSVFPNKLSKYTIEDIIENNPEEKYFYKKEKLNHFIKEFLKKNNFNSIKPTKEGLIKLFDIPKEILNDNERQRRVYSIKGKSPTVLARSDTTKILDRKFVRKLTPLECERFQTIPDNYTQYGYIDGKLKKISDTQRYKMIGNAFTVDVIAHFLKGIENPPLKSKKRNLFDYVY